MEDRVLLQFRTREQAATFFNWFKESGFDQLMGSEVGEAPQEPLFQCISADELPGEGCSDPDAFYLEIE
jgi:hypothetical protein